MSVEYLTVEGFKSLKERTEVPLRGLTVLAGANSSGKSSVVQPLLLLKQTFEAGFDPGPLLLNGPNVVFSETDQMFWRAPGDPLREHFYFGLGVTGGDALVNVGITFRRQRDGTPPLEIQDCTWTVGRRRVTLAEGLSAAEVEALIAPTEAERRWLQVTFGQLGGYDGLTVKRTRAFLVAALETPLAVTVFPDSATRGAVERAIRGVIHVPGLRGNPRRTYPVTAVEGMFPGLFQDYVASIIARWQAEDEERLARLGADLGELGLTWKVQARQRSDTEAEILVGRLPTAGGDDGADLVSIADVGFGFSQSLPVAVALLAASPGHLVYLEQPEIHLHPRAQVGLAALIRRAVNRGVQVIVETHSELLLIGIQKAVAKGELEAERALLHWFIRDEDGVTEVVTAEFDDQGALGDVPVDFAEVGMTAMREYLDAATPEG